MIKNLLLIAAGIGGYMLWMDDRQKKAKSEMRKAAAFSLQSRALAVEKETRPPREFQPARAIDAGFDIQDILSTIYSKSKKKGKGGGKYDWQTHTSISPWSGKSPLPKGIPETHREAWEVVKRCAPREGATIAQAYELWLARGYSSQDPQRLISLGC